MGINKTAMYANFGGPGSRDRDKGNQKPHKTGRFCDENSLIRL